MITRKINLFAWKLKKAFGLDWGTALRLAIQTEYIPGIERNDSVFGQWTAENTRAIAGHFWALWKASENPHWVHVAKKLYTASELGGASFAEFIKQEKIREKTMIETVLFFKAAWLRTYTRRSLETGAHIREIKPEWRFK